MTDIRRNSIGKSYLDLFLIGLSFSHILIILFRFQSSVVLIIIRHLSRRHSTQDAVRKWRLAQPAAAWCTMKDEGDDDDCGCFLTDCCDESFSRFDAGRDAESREILGSTRGICNESEGTPASHLGKDTGFMHPNRSNNNHQQITSNEFRQNQGREKLRPFNRRKQKKIRKFAVEK